MLSPLSYSTPEMACPKTGTVLISSFRQSLSEAPSPAMPPRNGGVPSHGGGGVPREGGALCGHGTAQRGRASGGRLGNFLGSDEDAMHRFR